MICLWCRYYDKYKECCTVPDFDEVESGSTPCTRESSDI